MILARILTLVVLIALLCFGHRASAQTVPDARATTTRFETTVRGGPGRTYRQVLIVEAGAHLTIIERNRVGNWLHVVREGSVNVLAVDGWAMSGHLFLDADLRFSELPVNTLLHDADSESISDVHLARLYTAPVVSDVDEDMRDVYEQGLTLGNHADVVTKVGDSLSADPLFLRPMSRDDSIMGPYDYLTDALAFFGPSTENPSAAAAQNLATYAVLDPLYAPSYCRRHETPLDCEYRLKRPSIALIMFGPNDARHILTDEFRANMHIIIDETLTHGTIPVLSTFSADLTTAYGPRSLEFNLALIELADEYDVPLINLWAAAHELPDYGLEGDYVHMTHSGFVNLKFDTGQESWYGVPLRNLLSIYMLDQLRETLDMR